MRKAALLFLGPVLATVVLFACDDAGGGGGNNVTFDGGTFDAPPIPPGQDAQPAPDADVDAGPMPVTVVVTFRGKPKSGVTVVWHDTTGAVLSTSATDATGMAKSSGATPAMASALLGDPAKRTEVVTWVGIAAGDVLATKDIDEPSENTVGYLGVTLLGGDPQNGASFFEAVTASGCSGSTMDPTQIISVPLYEDCAVGNVPVLVRAFGVGSVPLSMAFKKGNVSVADGGTTAVTTGAWLTPADVTIKAKNAPNNALLYAELQEIADGHALTTNTSDSYVGEGQTATYKVATGFADAYQVGVRGTPPGAPPASEILLGKRATGTAFELDYADVLPTIDTCSADLTDRKRPKIVWTSTASLGATDGASVAIAWNDSVLHGWRFILGPTATEVKAPALPLDKAAWTIGDADASVPPSIDEPDVVFVESDLLPSYAAFRPIAANVVPGSFSSGKLSGAVLPQNGTFRATQCHATPQ